jgi:hypothetical protein
MLVAALAFTGPYVGIAMGTVSCAERARRKIGIDALAIVCSGIRG